MIVALLVLLSGTVAYGSTTSVQEVLQQGDLAFLSREDDLQARNALLASPRCASCHFWTAINMALYGDTVGVFKMLFSLKEIEADLKKTIELDPGYAHAGAYRLLGLIQQKLPGILGGSNERALAYFKKAIEKWAH